MTETRALTVHCRLTRRAPDIKYAIRKDHAGRYVIAVGDLTKTQAATVCSAVFSALTEMSEMEDTP